jgi:uncharacterized membrane protein
MIYLIFSIVASTLFGLSFKVIAVQNVNSFQAIVFNYITAGSLGFIFTKSGITPLSVISQPFFLVAFFLGLVFISSLFVIAEVTAKQGVSVAQVSNRMSVVVPISIAILFYGDSISIVKVIGILLALSAVYLVSHKSESSSAVNKFWWLFPALIFVCSGIIDSSINYAQRYLLDDTNFDVFLSAIFSSAFVFGIIILSIQLLTKKQNFQIKSLPFGIVLGAINYSTMYFIVKALSSGVMEPSILFPINNLSILTLSTLISVLFFKEKMSIKNWIGIALSVLAIFILGDIF